VSYRTTIPRSCGGESSLSRLDNGRAMTPDITPHTSEIDWSGGSRCEYDAATHDLLVVAVSERLDALHQPADRWSLAPRPSATTAMLALQVVKDGIDCAIDMLTVNVLERLAEDVLALDAELSTRVLMISQALALAAHQQRTIVTLREQLWQREAA